MSKKVEVQDPLEEVDIGDKGQACPRYVNKLLPNNFKKDLVKFLKNYKDCFV